MNSCPIVYLQMSFGEKPRYESTTFNRTIYAFKHGNPITYQQLEEARERSPIRGKWVDGVVREALGDGFSLTDENDELLDIDSDFQKFAEDTQFFRHFVSAIGDARCFGESGILIFTNGSILPVAPKFYEEIWPSLSEDQKANMNLDDLKPLETIVRHFHSSASIGQLTWRIPMTGNNDPFIKIILNEKAKINQGRSVLEQIWDISESIDTITFNTGLLAGRYGHGPKVVKFNVADDAEEAKIYSTLEKFDYSSRAIIPEGAEWVNFGSVGLNNMPDLYKLLIQDLAAATGMPQAYWMGEIPGQMAGADNNEKQKFEVYNIIQNQAKLVARQLLKILSLHHFTGLPEDFHITWSTKQELTDTQKAELEKAEGESDTLRAQYMTGSEIRAQRGLESLDFFETEEAQKPLQIQLTESSSNFNMNVNGLDDTESKEKPESEPEDENKDESTDKSEPESEPEEPITVTTDEPK